MNTIEFIKSKLEEIGFSKESGSILYSGNETIKKEIKSFYSAEGLIKINSENRLIKLISTPHLSRYKINAKGIQHGDAYDTRSALDWFRNEISKFLKNDS